MPVPAFALFDSPIGPCGIAWTAAGISGLQLPGADAEGTRRRMSRRFPGAVERPVPPGVQRAIDRILALLSGGRDDLADLPLDLSGVPAFDRRVYEAARNTPPGRTTSYGAIARQLDAPTESRAVGQALGRNPVAIIVPCHRVLGADGRMGGFSAPGGTATKRRMLEIEGAAALSAGPLFS
jgi:methylated-DNA-[protein]-cysteine S-methyltransferase